MRQEIRLYGLRKGADEFLAALSWWTMLMELYLSNRFAIFFEKSLVGKNGQLAE
jgi:hypothetical protein